MPTPPPPPPRAPSPAAPAGASAADRGVAPPEDDDDDDDPPAAHADQPRSAARVSLPPARFTPQAARTPAAARAADRHATIDAAACELLRDDPALARRLVLDPHLTIAPLARRAPRAVVDAYDSDPSLGVDARRDRLLRAIVADTNAVGGAGPTPVTVDDLRRRSASTIEALVTTARAVLRAIDARRRELWQASAAQAAAGGDLPGTAARHEPVAAADTSSARAADPALPGRPGAHIAPPVAENGSGGGLANADDLIRQRNLVARFASSAEGREYVTAALVQLAAGDSSLYRALSSAAALTRSTHPGPRAPPNADAVLAQACWLVCEGRPRAAADKYLSSSGVASPSPELVASKFPRIRADDDVRVRRLLVSPLGARAGVSPTPIISPTPARPEAVAGVSPPARAVEQAAQPVLAMTMDDLSSGVHRSMNAAPGLYGLTGKALLASLGATGIGSAGWEAALKVCNNMLAGRIDRALLDGFLVPLAKPGGADIRPVVVPELLVKIPARFVAGLLNPVVARKHPWQFAAGVPCGGEALSFFLRDSMSCGQSILKVDSFNAFNMMDRWAFLSVAREDLPEVCPFLEGVYGGATRVYYVGGSAAVTRGVLQGDPAGPACFCLGLGPALESVPLPPGVSLYAYADDIFFRGDDPRALVGLLGPVTEALASVGLSVNCTKSALWLGLGVERSSVGADCPVPVLGADAVLDVLGVPFSASGSVEADLDARFDAVMRDLGDVLRADDPQLVMHLLKKVVVPRTTFLLRTVPPSVLLAPLDRFRNEFHDRCRAAFGLQRAAKFEPLLWFPVRHGGVGVPSWSDNSTVATFLAGAAAYVALFKDSSTGPLRLEAASLAARLPQPLALDKAALLLVSVPPAAAALAPLPVRQPNSPTPNEAKGAQRRLVRGVLQTELAECVRRLRADSPVVAEAATLLAHSNSRAVVDLLPFPDLRLPKTAMQSVLKFRYRSGEVPFVCSCSTPVSADSWGHPVLCVRPEQTKRHNAVRGLLGSLFAQTGALVQYERRLDVDHFMDIVVSAPDRHTLAVDVSVSGSDQALGALESECSTAKNHSYRALTTSQNMSFFVFFLSASGVPGPASEKAFMSWFGYFPKQHLRTFQRKLAYVLACSVANSYRVAHLSTPALTVNSALPSRGG